MVTILVIRSDCKDFSNLPWLTDTSHKVLVQSIHMVQEETLGEFQDGGHLEYMNLLIFY